MGIISSYADDATTGDSDRFLTYADDGSTKLTPASHLKGYLGQTAGTSGASDAGTTLQTIRSEVAFDYIASGCVISITSGLGWTMTSGVVYIGGRRLTVASATGTLTASKDTYFDLLDPGSGSVATLVNTGVNIVTNNTASPALAGSSLRLGILVSGASTISSVNQGQETMVLPIASSVPYAVTDSLGNLICPRDPNRKILGYRQITGNITTTNTSATQVTGLSCPVIVPTNRKVKVSSFAEALYNSAADAKSLLTLWDGTVGSGTQISQATGFQGGGSGATNVTISTVVTPSSASKTYNVGLHSNAAGTATIEGGATYPEYILVELV